MTPKLFAKFAMRFNEKRNPLAITVAIGISMLFLSSFFSSEIDQLISYKIVFRVLIVAVTFSSGFLFIIGGFGPSSNLNPEKMIDKTGLTRVLLQLQSWWLTVFLNLWFIVGITWNVLKIFQQTLNS